MIIIRLHCLSRTWEVLRLFPPKVCTSSFLQSINLSRCITQRRPISISQVYDKNTVSEKSETNAQKSAKLVQINLISIDNSIIVTTLEAATKLARRKNLILKKNDNVDPNAKKQTYHLVSPATLATVNTPKQNKNKTYKSLKLITLHTKIESRDFNIKCKHIQKLVDKKHEVKVIIMSSRGPNSAVEMKIAQNVIDFLKDSAKCSISGKDGARIVMISPIIKQDSQEDKSENEKEIKNTDESSV